jgi:salicylate hydroxylase
MPNLNSVLGNSILTSRRPKIQEAKASNPDQTFEASLKARINAFGGEDVLSWIYGNNIEEVWTEFLEREKTRDAN